MLLPALQRAREQARLVNCLSNIRQCGMVAIGMYANDHDGKVVPLIGIRAGHASIPYAEFWYSGGMHVALENASPPYDQYTASFADLMQPYFDSRNTRDMPGFQQYSQAFYCPADYAGMDGEDQRVGWWANGRGWREFSWRMNVDITPLTWDPVVGYSKPIFGRKVAVKAPSEKVLMIESHYESVSGAAWGSVNADWNLNGVLTPNPVQRYLRWSPARHRTGFTCVFFDGSARIISFRDRTKFCFDLPGGNWFGGNYAIAGLGPNWDLDQP